MRGELKSVFKQLCRCVCERDRGPREWAGEGSASGGRGRAGGGRGRGEAEGEVTGRLSKNGSGFGV